MSKQIPWNKGLSTAALGKSRLRKLLLTVPCKQCSFPVTSYPSQARKFCSQSCRSLYVFAPERNPLRGKSQPHNRGPNHYRWKGGGDHAERTRFRDTMQALIFERDDFTCQVCFKRGGYIQVDHIQSWAEFPELRFVADNCRTLCMPCHYYVTFKRKMPEGTVWGHNLSKRVAS